LNAEFFGFLSGGLVVVSSLPYAIRTYQGKIHPRLTSWSLWTLIGFALLLTYKSSGAEANVWPAVFGFINPFIITVVLIVRQRSRMVKPDRVEIACLVIGIISLAMWLGMRQSRELVQYALYIAILADACAAIPTIKFVWTQPDGDRPFAWGLFSLGYFLAIFAITEHTFSNWALPIYMFLGSFSIAFPLALRRWRKKSPLAEWI